MYKLVLNISCQHLGDECNLEGFLVPFGHRVGGMYIFGIYVSWLNICLYWLYHANTWEMNVIWRVSLCHSDTLLWECTVLEYMLVEVRGQPSTGQPSTWTTIRSNHKIFFFQKTTIRYHKKK